MTRSTPTSHPAPWQQRFTKNKDPQKIRLIKTYKLQENRGSAHAMCTDPLFFNKENKKPLLPDKPLLQPLHLLFCHSAANQIILCGSLQVAALFSRFIPAQPEVSSLYASRNSTRRACLFSASCFPVSVFIRSLSRSSLS